DVLRPTTCYKGQSSLPPNFKKPLLPPSGDRFCGEEEWGDAALVGPTSGGNLCSPLMLCVDTDAALVRPALGGPPRSSLALCANS
ncbi:hypothetical protein A2U01_0068973, partial [Trifolium medium]|nr:hypothetical protein [Trifolium medium]